MLLLLLACHVAEPPVCAGETLFGAPDGYTGLDASECSPTCADCGGEPWTQPTYTDADHDDWRARRLLDTITPLATDPYADPLPTDTDGPDTVCAVVAAGAGDYRLQTYDSTAAAVREGATPTHFGHCGACSTLADLAVYASVPELTIPVRECGMTYLAGPPEDHVACLQAIGFTEACAWVWYYNTVHTREACGDVCMAAYDEPWNQPDGSLNDCLQCDEDESGAVFKAYAGRTRRNTGLASTICRPCAEVRPLVHAYP